MQKESAIVECRGKAFQAIISLLFPTEGYAALAPGYLHRKRCVQPSRLVVINNPVIIVG